MRILTPQERSSLRWAISLLRVDKWRFVSALLLASLGIGSSIALGATSAWLIARASQMPPVLVLSVAATSVRLFGVSRAVLRYIQRLVSHRVALEGMDHLRLHLYDQIAQADLSHVTSLRRGDLLARIGSDVDEVGDFIVKSALPAGVAAIVGCGTVGALALLSPGAAVILALCLIASGVLAPLVTARAQRTAQVEGIEARSSLSSALVTVIDGYDELAINGLVGRAQAELERAEDRIESSRKGAARASAWSQFIDRAAMGCAVVGALLVGIPSVNAQILSAVALAVIALTPLSSFEASSQMNSAVAQLVRSAQAAARIDELIGPRALLSAKNAGQETADSTQGAHAASGKHKETITPEMVSSPLLRAENLSIGWPNSPELVEGLDLEVERGRSIAIVGPSGIGKTTLLYTLAGLIPPREGSLTLNDVSLMDIPHEESSSVLQVTAEDAHIFATSIFENLRVANPDLDKQQALDLLSAVGLEQWCASLPEGIDTLIGAGATGVSGGERRRLLVARALASPAPIILIDEASEHLDPQSADALMRTLAQRTRQRGLLIVTHRLSALQLADEIILMGYPEGDPRRRPAQIIARGTFEQLAQNNEHFRWALSQEDQ